MTTPAREYAWLDWFGCATFRMRTDPGVTIFLDAYLDRVPSAEQSGVGIDSITEADWVHPNRSGSWRKRACPKRS